MYQLNPAFLESYSVADQNLFQYHCLDSIEMKRRGNFLNVEKMECRSRSGRAMWHPWLIILIMVCFLRLFIFKDNQQR